MNFNYRFKCKTCESLIDSRIGMSNCDVQPLMFACPSCADPIEITVSQGKGVKFKGVETPDFDGPFTGEHPFVDLHLDFPVSFSPYVMGQTPFMKAISRIGHENYSIHNHRLNALNELYPLAEELKRLIRLYNKNPDLFSRLAESRFKEKVRSKEPKDVNLALYAIIAKVFFPFSMPNADAVDLYMSLFGNLVSADKAGFDAFMKEIIDSKFLHNIQKDCLSVYPRILAAELPLRPALFLDFDESYKGELTSFRVSNSDFNEYKDFYKDISEIISRQLILVAALNNLKHRGDFNKFHNVEKHTPKILKKYADVAYGKKVEHLDDCWYQIASGTADNQLRNSIAHFKTEYNEITQNVKYYPKNKGIDRKKEENIYFLDFMRKILISYREMHRMHQIIKCLHNYHFFIYGK